MSEFRTHEPNTAQWQAELVKLQSEVARERPRSVAPPPDRLPRKRPRRASKLLLALAAVAVLVAVLFGPGILGSLLDRWDYARSVHQDRSRAEHGIRPQLARQALVVVRDADGNPVRALANADALSGFVRAELQRVESARRDTHARVRAAYGVGNSRVHVPNPRVVRRVPEEVRRLRRGMRVRRGEDQPGAVE